MGETGVGRGAGRISSAGRDLDDDCGAVAETEKALTVKDTKLHEGKPKDPANCGSRRIVVVLYSLDL